MIQFLDDLHEFRGRGWVTILRLVFVFYKRTFVAYIEKYTHLENKYAESWRQYI